MALMTIGTPEAYDAIDRYKIITYQSIYELTIIMYTIQIRPWWRNTTLLSCFTADGLCTQQQLLSITTVIGAAQIQTNDIVLTFRFVYTLVLSVSVRV